MPTSRARGRARAAPWACAHTLSPPRCHAHAEDGDGGDGSDGEAPLNDAAVEAITAQQLQSATGVGVPPLTGATRGSDATVPLRYVPAEDPITRYKAVSVSTVYRLMLALGWGLRTDGAVVQLEDHDRPDIVLERNAYLQHLSERRHRIVTVFTEAAAAIARADTDDPFTDDELRRLGLDSAALVGDEKPILLVSADEACFTGNEVRQKTWAHPDIARARERIPAKTKGGTIMMFAGMSGFGYAGGVVLSVGSNAGGWWTNARLIQLMREDGYMAGLTQQFPRFEIILTVDNSPNHRQMAFDALDATKLNKTDGGRRKGKAIELRNTYTKVDEHGDKATGGKPLRLVNAKGKTMGLRSLVRALRPGFFGEDVASVDDWSKQEMAEWVLQERPDFAKAATLLQDTGHELGVAVEYTPRKHCELQPIERFWALVKRMARVRLTDAAGGSGAGASVQTAESLRAALQSVDRDAPTYASRSTMNAMRYAQLFFFELPSVFTFETVRTIVGHGRRLPKTVSHRHTGLCPEDDDDEAGAGDGERGDDDAAPEGSGGSDDDQTGDKGGAAAAAAAASSAAAAGGEATGRLSSEATLRLVREADLDPDELLDGAVGRDAKHNPYCQRCMGGQGASRALHACGWCYNVYHTACIVPHRAAMPMPGAEFACSICCRILEDGLLGLDPDKEEYIAAAMEEEAGGPPEPRPVLEPRDVYNLLTRWTHWGDTRIEARWRVIEERFAAQLASWPDVAVRNVEAALLGTRSAHPMIALESTGRRSVEPPAAGVGGVASDDE